MFVVPISFSCFCASCTLYSTPNLIVIMTDEHNLRSIGAYRDYLRNLNQTDQANMWGAGNNVKTPNIDRLANEGALFTNFYTNVPSCTPSRAIFMSGLYSSKTGAYKNGLKMKNTVKTWANVLRSHNYDTAYVGKWHLDGDINPGVFNTLQGNDKKRHFGFKNNDIRYNAGHSKYLKMINRTLHTFKFKKKFAGKDTPGGMRKHFVTDFLFRRSKKQIRKYIKRGKPFALMLSIPDPHGPNQVRPPFDEMYSNMKLKLPQTFRSRYQGHHIHPKFDAFYYNNAMGDSQNKTSVELEEFENDPVFQNEMQKYFGMVKCIDVNVGRLMQFLKREGIEDNTIVVFTSDHGDMLYEHGKVNKGLPYKASAGIPFIVRYPKNVMPGKVIETAHSHLDFAPTILNLMGIDHNEEFDGNDFSADLLSNDKYVNDVEKVTLLSHSFRHWISATSSEFKLVLATRSVPWLFDLKADPDETINYFDDPAYKNVKDFLLEKLLQGINDSEGHFPPFPKEDPGKNTFYWNRKPACLDSRDYLPIKRQRSLCSDLGRDVPRKMCKKTKVKRHCPMTCNSCCNDTVGGKILHYGKLFDCSELKDMCYMPPVKKFCPVTCQYGGCIRTQSSDVLFDSL